MEEAKKLDNVVKIFFDSLRESKESSEDQATSIARSIAQELASIHGSTNKEFRDKVNMLKMKLKGSSNAIIRDALFSARISPADFARLPTEKLIPSYFESLSGTATAAASISGSTTQSAANNLSRQPPPAMNSRTNAPPPRALSRPGMPRATGPTAPTQLNAPKQGIPPQSAQSEQRQLQLSQLQEPLNSEQQEQKSEIKQVEQQQKELQLEQQEINQKVEHQEPTKNEPQQLQQQQQKEQQQESNLPPAKATKLEEPPIVAGTTGNSKTPPVAGTAQRPLSRIPVRNAAQMRPQAAAATAATTPNQPLKEQPTKQEAVIPPVAKVEKVPQQQFDQPKVNTAPKEEEAPLNYNQHDQQTAEEKVKQQLNSLPETKPSQVNPPNVGVAPPAAARAPLGRAPIRGAPRAGANVINQPPKEGVSMPPVTLPSASGVAAAIAGSTVKSGEEVNQGKVSQQQNDLQKPQQQQQMPPQQQDNPPKISSSIQTTTATTTVTQTQSILKEKTQFEAPQQMKNAANQPNTKQNQPQQINVPSKTIEPTKQQTQQEKPSEEGEEGEDTHLSQLKSQLNDFKKLAHQYRMQHSAFDNDDDDDDEDNDDDDEDDDDGSNSINDGKPILDDITNDDQDEEGEEYSYYDEDEDEDDQEGTYNIVKSGRPQSNEPLQQLVGRNNQEIVTVTASGTSGVLLNEKKQQKHQQVQFQQDLQQHEEMSDFEQVQAHSRPSSSEQTGGNTSSQVRVPSSQEGHSNAQDEDDVAATTEEPMQGKRLEFQHHQQESDSQKTEEAFEENHNNIQQQHFNQNQPDFHDQYDEGNQQDHLQQQDEAEEAVEQQNEEIADNYNEEGEKVEDNEQFEYEQQQIDDNHHAHSNKIYSANQQIDNQFDGEDEAEFEDQLNQQQQPVIAVSAAANENFDVMNGGFANPFKINLSRNNESKNQHLQVNSQLPPHHRKQQSSSDIAGPILSAFEQADIDELKQVKINSSHSQQVILQASNQANDILTNSMRILDALNDEEEVEVEEVQKVNNDQNVILHREENEEVERIDEDHAIDQSSSSSTGEVGGMMLTGSTCLLSENRALKAKIREYLSQQQQRERQSQIDSESKDRRIRLLESELSAAKMELTLLRDAQNKFFEENTLYASATHAMEGTFAKETAVLRDELDTLKQKVRHEYSNEISMLRAVNEELVECNSTLQVTIDGMQQDLQASNAIIVKLQNYSYDQLNRSAHNANSNSLNYETTSQILSSQQHQLHIQGVNGAPQVTTTITSAGDLQQQFMLSSHKRGNSSSNPQQQQSTQQQQQQQPSIKRKVFQSEGEEDEEGVENEDENEINNRIDYGEAVHAELEVDLQDGNFNNYEQEVQQNIPNDAQPHLEHETHLNAYDDPIYVHEGEQEEEVAAVAQDLQQYDGYEDQGEQQQEEEAVNDVQEQEQHQNEQEQHQNNHDETGEHVENHVMAFATFAPAPSSTPAPAVLYTQESPQHRREEENEQQQQQQQQQDHDDDYVHDFQGGSGHEYDGDFEGLGGPIADVRGVNYSNPLDIFSSSSPAVPKQTEFHQYDPVAAAGDILKSEGERFFDEVVIPTATTQAGGAAGRVTLNSTKNQRSQASAVVVGGGGVQVPSATTTTTSRRNAAGVPRGTLESAFETEGAMIIGANSQLDDGSNFFDVNAIPSVTALKNSHGSDDVFTPAGLNKQSVESASVKAKTAAIMSGITGKTQQTNATTTPVQAPQLQQQQQSVTKSNAIQKQQQYQSNQTSTGQQRQRSIVATLDFNSQAEENNTFMSTDNIDFFNTVTSDKFNTSNLSAIPKDIHNSAAVHLQQHSHNFFNQNFTNPFNDLTSSVASLQQHLQTQPPKKDTQKKKRTAPTNLFD